MILPYICDVDISQPLLPTVLQPMMVTGDKLANRIGVRLKNGNQDYTPDGSCRGIVLRADGVMVPILDGVVSGNVMYIDLPEDAYAVPGTVVISIMCVTSTAVTTVFVGSGSIIRTQSGVMIDPGTVIDDISTLIQEIETAVASIPDDYSTLSTKVAALTEDGAVADAFRTRPLYDHLFVNTLSASVAIPHQSLFHVRRSRQLGFRIIEANMQQTSDGVFVVNHFTSGKFGAFFTHVDGVTDISDVAVSSVTWDWIVANVRYKSTIPKYRVHPPRLEEFLGECRQQGMIPFAQISYAEAAQIVESYMGKENYIAYGATREICPTAMIYKWAALTTKADILAACQALGAPMIYGMANPQAFTDSELRDIVDTLHRNGFRIATSYKDEDWYRYAALGFDLNGTQWQINRLETGNLCNFDTVYGFEHFAITGATEADGVLTFTAAGTITPQVDDAVRDLCAVDLEMDFTGSITLPAFGELQAATRAGVTYTSDGSCPVFVAVPIVHGSPNITLSVASGTVIRDIRFKASDYSDAEDLPQRVTAADARITVLESVVGGGEGMTPAQLSAIAASGHADNYFSVGDIIQIPWTDRSGDTAVEYQMPFVIVDIADAYDENDTKHEKAVWLQALRTTPYAIPFHAEDRTEVDLSTETTAVSGWAYVGLSGTTYTALNLSPGDPIPTTYDAVYKTTYTGLAQKAVQTGIARWKDSDARQWLNSTAAKNAGWWTSQYEGATPPAAEYTNKPGFLGGFSAEWQAVFKPVRRSNGAYLDEVTQTTDITYDKVFLPHWANVYATYTSGDNVNWPYWVSAVGTSSPTPNSNEARVLSPLGSTSTVTWLLSSYRLASRMDQVRGINSRGAMDYYNSNSAYRMAPCVCMY